MEHQAFAQLLGNYGEFVGAIAVVATLFYLVIQVRQSKQATEANTRAIRGNAAWDAEIVFAQRNLGVARDPDHAELVQRVFAPGTEVNALNEMYRMRVFADTTSILQMVQAQYFCGERDLYQTRSGHTEAFGRVGT